MWCIERHLDSFRDSSFCSFFTVPPGKTKQEQHLNLHLNNLVPTKVFSCVWQLQQKKLVNLRRLKDIDEWRRRVENVVDVRRINSSWNEVFSQASLSIEPVPQLIVIAAAWHFTICVHFVLTYLLLDWSAAGTHSSISSSATLWKRKTVRMLQNTGGSLHFHWIYSYVFMHEWMN